MARIAVQQDGANAGGCSVKIRLRVQCKSQQLPISINHIYKRMLMWQRLKSLFGESTQSWRCKLGMVLIWMIGSSMCLGESAGLNLNPEGCDPRTELQTQH